MKRSPDSLYVAPDSAARAFTEAIAWLWRLGPVQLEPSGRAMGFGAAGEAGTLGRLIARGQLAGGVVFAASETGDRPLRPGSRVAEGIADFPDGRAKGAFTVFREGRPVLRSGLGAHAVEQDGVLYLGASPGDWGTVSAYWLFGVIAEMLQRTLARPLIMLPPLGCIRLDDVPGTGLQQLLGRDHPDSTMARRIRGLTRRYARTARASSSLCPRRGSSRASRLQPMRSGPNRSSPYGRVSGPGYSSRRATARCTWTSRRSRRARSSRGSSLASARTRHV